MASKREKLVQEAQSLGVDFDGGSTPDEEIQAKIDAVKARNPAEEILNENEDQPVVGYSMRCWNCANHGTKSRLNKQGVCEVCGFDVSLAYNGGIEAARDKARVQRTQEVG